MSLLGKYSQYLFIIFMVLTLGDDYQANGSPVLREADGRESLQLSVVNQSCCVELLNENGTVKQIVDLINKNYVILLQLNVSLIDTDYES